jgi:hypothetical protein
MFIGLANIRKHHYPVRNSSNVSFERECPGQMFNKMPVQSTDKNEKGKVEVMICLIQIERENYSALSKPNDVNPCQVKSETKNRQYTQKSTKKQVGHICNLMELSNNLDSYLESQDQRARL